ncbi:hypothetical protein HG530_006206 [Fusarium avenaceum]|nr:hypothetical protein HG530_006206 [Fusarium avenaceum]
MMSIASARRAFVRALSEEISCSDFSQSGDETLNNGSSQIRELFDYLLNEVDDIDSGNIIKVGDEIHKKLHNARSDLGKLDSALVDGVNKERSGEAKSLSSDVDIGTGQNSENLHGQVIKDTFVLLAQLINSIEHNQLNVVICLLDAQLDEFGGRSLNSDGVVGMSMLEAGSRRGEQRFDQLSFSELAEEAQGVSSDAGHGVAIEHNGQDALHCLDLGLIGALLQLIAQVGDGGDIGRIVLVNETVRILEKARHLEECRQRLAEKVGKPLWKSRSALDSVSFKKICPASNVEQVALSDLIVVGDGRSAVARYANNSNYRNDSLIRKEMCVSSIIVDEIKRIIKTSEITKEDDSKWPQKNKDGRQELEIRIGNDHIAFETAKIGSLVDVTESADPEGLRVFYYLVQDLKALVFSLIALHFKIKPI